LTETKRRKRRIRARHDALRLAVNHVDSKTNSNGNHGDLVSLNVRRVACYYSRRCGGTHHSSAGIFGEGPSNASNAVRLCLCVCLCMRVWLCVYARTREFPFDSDSHETLHLRRRVSEGSTTDSDLEPYQSHCVETSPSTRSSPPRNPITVPLFVLGRGLFYPSLAVTMDGRYTT
jgi:hypothetical protein